MPSSSTSKSVIKHPIPTYSKLGFKIDDFKMKPSNDNTLVSTFSCKEIPIKVGKVDEAVKENTTDTTNSANTANTTDTTNTANTTTTTNTTTSTNTTTN